MLNARLHRLHHTQQRSDSQNPPRIKCENNNKQRREFQFFQGWLVGTFMLFEFRRIASEQTSLEWPEWQAGKQAEKKIWSFDRDLCSAGAWRESATLWCSSGHHLTGKSTQWGSTKNISCRQCQWKECWKRAIHTWLWFHRWHDWSFGKWWVKLLLLFFSWCNVPTGTKAWLSA